MVVREKAGAEEGWLMASPPCFSKKQCDKAAQGRNTEEAEPIDRLWKGRRVRASKNGRLSGGNVLYGPYAWEEITRPRRAEKVSMGGSRTGRGFCVGCSFLPLYVQAITSPIGYAGSSGRPLVSGRDATPRTRRPAASGDDWQLLTITAIFYIVG